MPGRIAITKGEFPYLILQAKSLHVQSFLELQEKYKEHDMFLYIALIDLTKTFDLASREGLFAMLLKIFCFPSLFNTVKFFHTNTKATVKYNGNLIHLRSNLRLSFNSFRDFLLINCILILLIYSDLYI